MNRVIKNLYTQTDVSNSEYPNTIETKIFNYNHIKIVFGLALILFLSVGCSGSSDTTMMNADEHLAYAMEMYEDGDFQFAVREFQSIILQFPGNTVNDDAQYFLAMSYFNDDQLLLAAYEFSKLIRDIKGSEFVSKSQFMLAESYYYLSPP